MDLNCADIAPASESPWTRDDTHRARSTSIHKASVGWRRSCLFRRPAGSPSRPRFAAAVYRTAIREKLDLVKRFVRTLAPARRTVGVFHCAPGAEGQVDFFRGAPTSDAGTGEWRRPWVFRMTLGHSRHGYEEAVWDQKLETFLRLHERAFRDLGGVPLVTRHDNLKAAVVRACFFDPDSHEVYLAFAQHWGFTSLPTQPARRRRMGNRSAAVATSKTTR